MYAYQKAVLAMLEEAFAAEGAAIEATVAALCAAICDKRALYIFGASHAGILAEELYYRAGGLMLINPIFGSEIMLNRAPVTTTSRMEQLEGYGTVLADSVDFRAGDVLIVHSVSGRNAVAIDLVLAARAKGVQIIALTNLRTRKASAAAIPAASGCLNWPTSCWTTTASSATPSANCPAWRKKWGQPQPWSALPY